MEKKIVSEMVHDIILSKIVGMIEEMSTNEFIDEVVDKLVEGGVPVEVDNEEQMEEVKEIIGSRMIPLMKKVGEYLVDTRLFDEV